MILSRPRPLAGDQQPLQILGDRALAPGVHHRPYRHSSDGDPFKQDMPRFEVQCHRRSISMDIDAAAVPPRRVRTG
jgi:hypothetical protein